MRKLVKSGVPGLDELLKGGFSEGSTVAVKGGPGTGKSILSLQFVYEGCKNNENCLFILSEGNVDDIKNEAIGVGLNLEPFEKKGLLTFVKEKAKEPLSIAQPLQIIKEKKIKRVALDNITLFRYAAPSGIEFRKNFLHFVEAMNQVGVTLLVVVPSENYEMDIKAEPHDFLFDGLIMLTKIRKGATFERCVTVLKMRGQDHLLDIKPFKIEKKGIKIYTKQLPFSLK